jgi:hypothetical protein
VSAVHVCKQSIQPFFRKKEEEFQFFLYKKVSWLSTGSSCTRKLEVVHTDLMGPISPATTDDEKYALNVIDEFSEMSATILLKSKADASN